MSEYLQELVFDHSHDNEVINIIDGMEYNGKYALDDVGIPLILTSSLGLEQVTSAGIAYMDIDSNGEINRDEFFAGVIDWNDLYFNHLEGFDPSLLLSNEDLQTLWNQLFIDSDENFNGIPDFQDEYLMYTAEDMPLLDDSNSDVFEETYRQALINSEERSRRWTANELSQINYEDLSALRLRFEPLERQSVWLETVHSWNENDEESTTQEVLYIDAMDNFFSNIFGFFASIFSK